MKQRAWILFVLMGVTACEPAKETGKFFANNIKDSIYDTTYQIQEWAMTPPKGKGEPLPVPSRYCYRALADILCYRQPMPGWEGRLVSYQGTDAMPPPPPVMVLLPKPAKDTSMLPENRVAAAEPVFKEMPKAEEPKQDDEGGEPPMPNSLNEQLPDPSQSPQL